MSLSSYKARPTDLKFDESELLDIGFLINSLENHVVKKKSRLFKINALVAS